MKKLLKSKGISFGVLKFDLKMKLSALFILISILSIQANTYSQGKKITLDMENSSIEKIIDEIELISEFKFIFNTSEVDLNRRMSIKVKKQKIKIILEKLFEGTNTLFEIDNRKVLLLEDSKTIVPQINPEIIKQGHDISGVVLDKNGQPLPGANILEKNTSNGTQTDFDGKFALTVNDNNAILVVSYIGFVSTEITVNGQTSLNISLEEDTASLEEVVLIGYGSLKKSDLTGAVTSVAAEDIQALTVSNPTAALQGRVAGVNVQSNGGAPGAGVSVVIRGAGTLNGSLDPLYVVDGVFLDNLSSLNAADIASMEVLKDASAAAIYGSRAANGVVIISTTKGSKKEGLTINVHATTGVSNSTGKIDFLNARQYADVRNAIDDASNAPRAPINSTAFDPNVDTDWQSLSLRTGVVQDYGFNISNRGKQASVYFSANYFDEKGVLVSSDFNRINMRLNSEYWSENRKLKLSQSLGLTQKKLNVNNEYGAGGYNFPTLPFKDSEGNFVAPSNSDHGVAFSRNRYARAVTLDDENITSEVFGNIAAELEFLPGLKYRLNLGFNYSSEVDYLFVPTFFWSVSNQGSNQNLDADLSERRGTSFDGLIDNVISYNREIGKHSVNAILGSSFQKIKTRNTFVRGTKFPSNDLRVLSAAEEVDLFSGTEVVTGLASLYGRVVYDYDDKYFFTATLRQDKSSRFSEAFREGYFPSASAGWKISNEDFFPDSGVLSSLKLRLSYGELGSQNVADYAFTPVINLNSNYDFGDERFFGVSRTQFRLNNLVWEKSKTTNYGIDAEFFKGKLSANLDYYIRDTEDILLSLAIPQTSGSRQPVVTNAASIENKGVELSLNYRNSEREFTYNIGLNLTKAKNKVTSLGELNSPLFGGSFSAEALQGTRAIVGEQLGVFWGYESDGLYQSQSEIDNDPNVANSAGQRAILKPGDFIYIDQNDDGLINNDDKVNIGNPYPDFEFGVNFKAKYKNFEFDLFFQGQVGNEILNTTKYSLSFESRSNYSTDVLNAWSPTNTDTNFPVLGNTRFDVSPFYIEDGSYLRLKQLRVAYNFKDLFNSSSNAKVFVSGQNLLTITGYSGYDPEIGLGSGGDLLTRGVDYSSYPQSTQISLGVQFTFN